MALIKPLGSALEVGFAYTKHTQNPPFQLVLKHALVALLLLVIICIAQPSIALADAPVAVEPETIEQPIRSGLDADDISSEKVNQFVRSYLRVVDLMEQREGDIQAAETDSESNRIRQEIESEAFSIIQSAGLTPQEYLQLLGLANTDPEFGDRIVTQLQESSESF